MISAHADEHGESTEVSEIGECDRLCATVSPENEAIARAQRGEASAFESIYQRHSPRVYALCLRMVGNTAEAEDLTQEAFLLVLRKIRTFRGESAFSTWLHRITVNLVLMRLRRKTLLETPLEDTEVRGSNRHASREELGRADVVLTGSLDRLLLERAMEQLRPFQRLVVVLHDMQGYKHTEIAQMMDWSIGNSKSRLHRARIRLRSLLQESLSLNRIRSPQAAHPAFGA
ncbi:MAG: sigma-70 family RNA polymerase sigma factor [Candidatus Acidiferrum sp.]